MSYKLFNAVLKGHFVLINEYNTMVITNSQATREFLNIKFAEIKFALIKKLCVYV